MNDGRIISKEVVRYGSIFEHGTFPNGIENYATICDKILFSDVKERMQEWAILEAIKPTATESEKYFAVMLDKELTPENISDEIVKKALTVYKRRRTRVFTYGK